MGRIVISDDALPWLAPRLGTRAEDDVPWTQNREPVGTDDLRRASRMLHAGNRTEPQLFEVTCPPGDVVDPHAHKACEIVYVVEGQLRLGAQILDVGSSAFISANTLYGFQAGSTGVRFLNFRPCADLSYVSKSRFMESRKH
jgi:quercetin dioxygenase-like cupin family protein